ncbi:hypothetical protein [Mangrovibacterium lignilyticum]|uniref:hypothetical protein n=1 Tax=Mangrovibacterium lignilyticum TaxID=2668052 RepID=UPI0013D7E0DE|nr:hypothetical protein [Mangrovibacterium lignilyticum]
MKKLNLLFLMSLFLGVTLFTSCSSEDDPTYDAPAVNAPASSSVVAGETTTLEFAYSAAAGFKSSAVSATNGTASVTTDGTASATSGTIVVSFVASSTEGAGAVALTVTDAQGNIDEATAILTVEAVQTQFDIDANITENTTWETGNVYNLNSRIVVTNGAVLTIEPGVVIKGAAGTGANATALIIARGSKIMAEGTAASPIIFTSVADNLMPGEIASPNLDPTLNGLWGGLIVLGNAKVSVSTGTEAQIEGIPATDTNGLYGGDDDTDNSGVIQYVSIRHGGANIGEGNEINGLTLGGVGSGTTIENIEIVSNQDDGIEFFGGKPTVTNVVCWNVGDDALDTDQSFSGVINNALVINPGDECFELDGPEGTYQGAGHTITNVTCKVEDAQGLIDFDATTDVNMSNIYFYDLAAGQDVEEYDLYSANTLGFASSNFEVTLPTGVALTDAFKGGSDAITTEVAEGANTVGADLTVFADWTWAAVSSAY